MTPESMAALHGQAFTRGWSEAEIRELMARPGAVLIDGPEGFALAHMVLDEAELLTIVIDPAHQGRGIGARLLQTLCDTLKSKGVARLFLEVAEDNPAARALYAKLGFSEDGRRRGYYQRTDGAVDALLLSRPC